MVTVTRDREAVRTSRWSLIAVEVLVAVSAIYGGIGLIRNGMGMPDEWLEPTPFSSWLWPGIFLLAVIAAPMTVAAVLEVTRSPLAYLASMIAAACQIGWIIVHVAVLQRFFFLQPVLLGAGLLIGALALRSHRGHRLFPDPT
jgi:hypothetical protein